MQRRQATTLKKGAKGLDDTEKKIDAASTGKTVSAVAPESPPEDVEELWSTQSADDLSGMCVCDRTAYDL